MVVVDPQRAIGPGFSVSDETDLRSVQQVAQAVAELGAAESMADVVEAAVGHVSAAIGASVATLMVRDGSRLKLIAGNGLRPGVESQWSTFDVADDNPASEAVRDGRPIMLGGPDVIAARYPVLRGQVPAGRSLVCLPLGSRGEPVGVVGLTFEGGWLPTERELALLTTFADSCGQTLRRLDATAEAERTTKRLAFLAAASQELSGSLDYRATLSNVARLAVPELADWCAVSVMNGDALTTVAVAHVDPAKVQWAWQLQDEYPPDANDPTGVANVIRTGVSELYESITDEMLVAGARDERHLQLSRELNLRSAIVVPLTARGRTHGAITLIRAENDQPYTTQDLALAEEVGQRAGLAIDNATLYRRAQDAALQLQQAVLPDALDHLPGWQVSAHYTPGGDADVGGDLYDAIDLGGGRLAVVIGDVAGHGVAAAASMAQLRASMRALLSVDPDPAAVLTRLDTMYDRLDMHQLATTVYGVLDRTACTFTFVNAGHYPPVLVSGEGAVLIDRQPQRALGVGGDAREPTVVAFGPADVLVLYTDGLVERRDEVVDVGLQRLVDVLAVADRDDLSHLLAHVVDAVATSQSEDDVTALAVRMDGC